MTTQIRPASGGTWNTVQQDTTKTSKKNTTFGVTLTTAYTSQAFRAMNEWINCGGVGTASVRAQNLAAAIGLQLQEV